MKVSKLTQKKAKELYNDLLENKQEIVLIPAPEPRHSEHKIRVVQNRPPKWFSKFVNQFTKSTKKYPRVRPKVYRREVLIGLSKLSNGENNSCICMRLQKFIENMMDDEVPF